MRNSVDALSCLALGVASDEASLCASDRAKDVGIHVAARTATAVMLPQRPCRQGAAIGALFHGLILSMPRGLKTPGSIQ